MSLRHVELTCHDDCARCQEACPAALIVRRRRHPPQSRSSRPISLSRRSTSAASPVPSSYFFTCASPPSGPSSSAPASPPASCSPRTSESSHTPPSPTASTFSDSTCTSVNRPYSVLTADAPFPYNGTGAEGHGSRRAPLLRRPFAFSFLQSPCLLRRGGRATPRASMRRMGQGRRFHLSVNAKEEGDDSGVYVQEESYEEQDWTLAPPALPSPTSQTSFYPLRTSTPPPRTGPSSPTRSFPMVHTGNAFPPSSGSSLPRVPTAHTFPIATSPKAKSRRLPRRTSSP
ncbi:hypothetical protein MVEN_01952400 [Mycena venus]|uniref:Uncharacterized protein n=1 Tax=Mycena venus TaxID=2733690 RepID=A0A8H7CLG7_9AGAR|nr:hypothetical protein MVEN_01952400 [Mycena venus]